MNYRILSTLVFAILLGGCSSAYRQSQTPDDVYYSPAPGKDVSLAKNTKANRQDAYANNNGSDQDQYEDYTSSSDDRYLRMKAQNYSRWNSLDDYDYWNTPNYAYNNYYGYNSYNPNGFNNWGLSFYYSPFASIQPFGWYNNYYPYTSFYPSYGGGYYGHGYNGGYGYGYGYGYTPVYIVNQRPRYNTSRPMLGGYNNTNGYANGNRRNANGGRYVPANGNGRYNNSNSGGRAANNNYNNGNTGGRSANTNTTPAPTRSYTPAPSSSSSSSSGSSSSGGGVSRQGKH